MAAHQASPSLGFSRQEYWSGLPFPSPDSHKLGLPKDSYQFNISQCQLFPPCLHAQSSNGICLSWMNLCQDTSWLSNEHSYAFQIHKLTSPEPNEEVDNTEGPSTYHSKASVRQHLQSPMTFHDTVIRFTHSKWDIHWISSTRNKQFCLFIIIKSIFMLTIL